MIVVAYHSVVLREVLMNVHLVVPLMVRHDTALAGILLDLSSPYRFILVIQRCIGWYSPWYLRKYSRKDLLRYVVQYRERYLSSPNDAFVGTVLRTFAGTSLYFSTADVCQRHTAPTRLYCISWYEIRRTPLP
jgi:hypothetical protein